jgi:hypothetical protein
MTGMFAMRTIQEQIVFLLTVYPTHGHTALVHSLTFALLICLMNPGSFLYSFSLFFSPLTVHLHISYLQIHRSFLLLDLLSVVYYTFHFIHCVISTRIFV